MNNMKLLKQTEIIFTFRKLDRTLKMILGFCLCFGKWTSEIEFIYFVQISFIAVYKWYNERNYFMPTNWLFDPATSVLFEIILKT